MEVAEDRILQRPAIRGYTCYRRYILAFFEYKKAQRSGFSHRKFAELSGMKSPNYLQLVMRGERNLSVDRSYSVAHAMKLSDAEIEYFVSLVRQENAKSAEELRFAEKESLRAIKKLTAAEIQDESFKVLNKWYHLAIRELSFLPDFELTSSYVCKKLKGLVTEAQAEESLELLIRLGLLVLKDGKWHAKDPVIDTGNDFLLRELALNFHQENLQMWSKSLAQVSYSEIETGLLNISLPQSRVPELREKLRGFQDELIGWLEGLPEADTTLQVGVYMFPLAKCDKDDRSCK